MRFVLVNGRTPRTQSFCALCCEPIGESYLRDITAQLAYCNHKCYVDRCKVPVFEPGSDIEFPAAFEDPTYMIVNLATGAENFGGVGFVDAKSPGALEFQIDRISTYQLDSATPRDHTTGDYYRSSGEADTAQKLFETSVGPQ